MRKWKKELAQGFCDYRQFRFGKLNTPQFRHLWLLPWWVLYGLLFMGVERIWTERNWTIVWCPLDDIIPFVELFVIPYMFWFVFLCGMLLFTLLFDTAAFRKMMYFIMITYTATIIIYLVFPTAQELRPDIAALGRDNFLTRFMAGFYEFDTNTNVCPSIHVIGSVAVLVASWHCKFFKTVPWQLFFWISTVLISVSTVFLKQHSVLDLPPAILLCVIAYPFAFHGDKILSRIRRKRGGKHATPAPLPQAVDAADETLINQ